MKVITRVVFLQL